MGELFVKFLESIKTDNRALKYLMLLALFFCLSYLMKVNQSFISIFEMVFKFDITNILLILFRYLLFAYKLCCVGLLVSLFSFAIFEGINGINFSELRFENSFFCLWSDFTVFNRNFAKIVALLYLGVDLFFRIVSYLLMMIITVGALLISEKISINYIYVMMQELLSKSHSEFVVILVLVFSSFIIFAWLSQWWTNIDKLSNKN